MFRVDDLDAARWQLEQRGAAFDDHVGEVEGFARFATFRDPDGERHAAHRVLAEARAVPRSRSVCWAPWNSDACPRCGEPLPAGAHFCPNCGAPVSISAASERRVVTVVFVDLAGSTELAAHLDPERFREVLAAFHGMVTDEIAALGGRAERFIGDAVLGVFGVPVVHDDDALRGIRAALAIVERAGRARGAPRAADAAAGADRRQHRAGGGGHGARTATS